MPINVKKYSSVGSKDSSMSDQFIEIESLEYN